MQMAALVIFACGAAVAEAKPLKIVAFGDSLTAGYEMAPQSAFPGVLEKRLKADGFDVEVVNAGVSGDTTTGGLERLDWSTSGAVDLVILELGANDMLRGIQPGLTSDLLEQIIRRLYERKIHVVIAGMRALANFGETYRKDFDKIYPALAAKFDAPLYPFFLEGVAGQRDLTLPDGIHPNPAGVERIVDKFAPFLEKTLVERFGARARNAQK